MEDQHYQNGLTSPEQGGELSDIELLRRAVGMLFGMDAAVAQ
jgi:hypothetical protein